MEHYWSPWNDMEAELPPCQSILCRLPMFVMSGVRGHKQRDKDIGSDLSRQRHQIGRQFTNPRAHPTRATVVVALDEAGCGKQVSSTQKFAKLWNIPQSTIVDFRGAGSGACMTRVGVLLASVNVEPVLPCPPSFHALGSVTRRQPSLSFM